MKTFTGAILILSTIAIDMTTLQAVLVLAIGTTAFLVGLVDD